MKLIDWALNEENEEYQYLIEVCKEIQRASKLAGYDLDLLKCWILWKEYSNSQHAHFLPLEKNIWDPVKNICYKDLQDFIKNYEMKEW